MLVSYPDVFIDPNNYDEPVTLKRDYFNIRASATLSKQLRVVLKEYEFTTDSGFLVNIRDTKEYVGVDRLWADTTDDGKSELTAIIYMNGRKETYKRSYLKLH